MSIDYSMFPIPKPNSKKKEKSKYIKGNKHTRTKATDIPRWVKEEVWNRDKHKCILCGIYVSLECACCHFIPRSSGRVRDSRKYIYRLPKLS